ncbi:DUF4166 domain-containing protein [soil metagenome]
MKSIYQHALGADFERLHPKIQERFGITSEEGIAHIGRGTMSRLWHGPWWTYPFLLLGTFRRIMFPEQGENVPFTIRNYVYRDPFGRETVTWIRDFATRRPRRFDAYMIFSEERNLVVDYMGSHQHLAVDLDLSVDPNGGLRIRSGEQRFYEGTLAFRFPMLFSGYAEVCEWFDDETGRFQIEVNVSNRRLGPLFGYRGSFDMERVLSQPVPEELLPLRVERRE